MADAPYEPTEAAIANVIEKTGGDPRKLAVAYLRAQKRARDSETAFNVMAKLDGAMDAAIRGDVSGVADGLTRATSVLRGHREQSEDTLVRSGYAPRRGSQTPPRPPSGGS
ncbi:hypothetical protein LCM17_20275 [Cereibacter sphaeroides]|nr:hypothetical protein [Cereibacter sphaeroides]